MLFREDQKGIVIDELTEYFDQMFYTERDLTEKRKIAQENIIKSQKSNEKFIKKKNQPENSKRMIMLLLKH